jgi:hypothetical protein
MENEIMQNKKIRKAWKGKAENTGEFVCLEKAN